MSSNQRSRFKAKGATAHPEAVNRKSKNQGIDPSKDLLEQCHRKRQSTLNHTQRKPTSIETDESTSHNNTNQAGKRKLSISPSATNPTKRHTPLNSADSGSQSDWSQDDESYASRKAANKSAPIPSKTKPLDVVLQLRDTPAPEEKMNELKISKLLKQYFPKAEINQLKILKDGVSFLVSPNNHESSLLLIDDKNWPKEIKQKFMLKAPPKSNSKTADIIEEFAIIAKRIDTSITSDEIKSELEEQGFKSITRIERFFKIANGSSSPMPIIKIKLTCAQELNQLYNNGLRLGYAQFPTEAPKNSLHPIQCYKCNKFNHYAKSCPNQPVCRFCGTTTCGSLHENGKTCDIKNDRTKYKCANCGDNHSAAYRGCLYFKELVELINEENPEKPAGDKIPEHLSKWHDFANPASIIHKSYASAAASHPTNTHPRSRPTQPATYPSELDSLKESIVQFSFNVLMLSTAENLLTPEVKSKLGDSTELFIPEKVATLYEMLAPSQLGIKICRKDLLENLKRVKPLTRKKVPSTSSCCSIESNTSQVTNQSCQMEDKNHHRDSQLITTTNALDFRDSNHKWP